MTNNKVKKGFKRNGILIIRVLFFCLSSLIFVSCSGSNEDESTSVDTNTNSIVTDAITGLMWQLNSNSKYNWYEASGTFDPTLNPDSIDICGSLELAGHHDWRLPTRAELMSIVDYSQHSPAINQNLLLATNNENYWTASSFAGNSDLAWPIYFVDGSSYADWANKSFQFYSRCVRGASFPPNNFINNLSGGGSATNIEYQYQGADFSLFNCGGNTICSTPDPNFTSYTSSNSVTVTITLDEPLQPNLVLQDIRSLPGFSLVIGDALQELYTPNEVLLSTNVVGDIAPPWSVLSNGPNPPNNGVTTVHWDGGRGIGDSGTLSAPTVTNPTTPRDQGYNFSGTGQWIVSGGGNSGDGTVSDLTTTLMWQKQVDGVARNWLDAQAYCDSMTLSDHSDWRLPLIKELFSIVDEAKTGPSIDTNMFPDTNSDYFWSSTTIARDPSEAWPIQFSDGSIPNYLHSKSTNYFVRCVRDDSNVGGGDNTPPVVTAPANITVSTASGSGEPASNLDIAAFLSGATATDDIDGDLTGSVINNAPATFLVGVTTVVFTVTDAAGNTGTDSATVTVIVAGGGDNTPPVVTAPADITVSTASGSGEPASNLDIAAFLSGATATDDIDGDLTGSVINNAPATFLVGVTTVVFTVTDAAGNTGTDSATVEVINTTSGDLLVLVEHYEEGQDGVTGLDMGGHSLSLSPDVRHLYAAGGHFAFSDQPNRGALVVFERNDTDGRLTHLQSFIHGDNISQMVAASDVAVSPDGLHVYVASHTTSFFNGRYLVFDRAADGLLTEKIAYNGGWLNRAIEISPDGNSVYIGGGHGLLSLARAADGFLTTITGSEEPGALDVDDIAISTDGTSLYTAGSRCPSNSGVCFPLTYGVVPMTRDTSTGALVAGEPIELPELAGTRRLELSSDGQYLFASGIGITVFQRSVDGRLTFLSHLAGVGGGNVDKLNLSDDGQLLFSNGELVDISEPTLLSVIDDINDSGRFGFTGQAAEPNFRHIYTFGFDTISQTHKLSLFNLEGR